MGAAAVWAFSATSIALLVAAGVVLGAISGLATGASGAMLPRLVEEDKLARVNSVYTVAVRVATILGSMVAGVLIAGPGLGVVMLANALTFGASLACVWSIRDAHAPLPAQDDARVWADALHGYRYVFGDAALRWLILSGLAMELGFSWAFNAGIAPLALDRGWGAFSLSATLATFATCGLLATLLGARWEDRAIWTRVILGQAAMGLGLIVMAGAGDRHVPWYVGAALVGCGSGQVGPMLITLVQQRADPSRMGVAMAAASMASLGSVSISIAIFGALASLMTAEVAWWASGVTVLLSPFAAMAARSALNDG
jgi:MFS transporter, DHA3 family, macrolide efflux protein